MFERCILCVVHPNSQFMLIRPVVMTIYRKSPKCPGCQIVEQIYGRTISLWSHVSVICYYFQLHSTYLGYEIHEEWIRTQRKYQSDGKILEGSFFKLTAPIIPWLRSSVLGANVRMYGVEPEEGNKICLTIKCITSCNSAIMKGSGSHKGCLIDAQTVL